MLQPAIRQHRRRPRRDRRDRPPVGLQPVRRHRHTLRGVVRHHHRMGERQHRRTAAGRIARPLVAPALGREVDQQSRHTAGGVHHHLLAEGHLDLYLIAQPVRQVRARIRRDLHLHHRRRPGVAAVRLRGRPRRRQRRTRRCRGQQSRRQRYREPTPNGPPGCATHAAAPLRSAWLHIDAAALSIHMSGLAIYGDMPSVERAIISISISCIPISMSSQGASRRVAALVGTQAGLPYRNRRTSLSSRSHLSPASPLAPYAGYPVVAPLIGPCETAINEWTEAQG